MRTPQDLLNLAVEYSQALPGRIRTYLNQRGIPDVVIDFHLIGWNGRRITIPIFNKDGALVFFKLARDPNSPASEPKMLVWPRRPAELYGWEQLKAKADLIIICEGEFDRLVLETQRFRALTSTGGARTFRAEWAVSFQHIPNVYICFDRDDAGRAGALKVGRLIPHAKIVELPAEVGNGGDVTDFFVRLGKSRKDFFKLLESAAPAPSLPTRKTPLRLVGAETDSDDHIDRIKRSVSIDEVIGRYLRLRRSGHTLTGLCPFHDDHVPSLVVYPETARFYCFGCQAHGDVITFVQKHQQVSFREALDLLENNANHHEFTKQRS